MFQGPMNIKKLHQFSIFGSYALYFRLLKVTLILHFWFVAKPWLNLLTQFFCSPRNVLRESFDLWITVTKSQSIINQVLKSEYILKLYLKRWKLFTGLITDFIVSHSEMHSVENWEYSIKYYSDMLDGIYKYALHGWIIGFLYFSRI